MPHESRELQVPLETGERQIASDAAHAGPIPPRSGRPIRAGSGVCINKTPGFFASVMRRATARPVTKCERVYVVIV